MLARKEPLVQAVIADKALPDGVRFLVARLAEALDPSAPLHRRGLAQSDPRAVIRDLTAALRADATAPSRHTWALLLARLERARELLGFDQALRKQWPIESAALQTALAAVGGSPTRATWTATGEPLVRPAAVSLRRALADPASGYRRYLTGLVCQLAASPLSSAPALRRAEERVGLLATMLLDEGQDACTIMRRVAAAAQEPAYRRRSAIERALWAGPVGFEVLVAAIGVPEGSTSDAAVRIHSLRRVVPDLRRFWPWGALARLVLEARAARASSIISVRLSARDEQHALRAARTVARQVCAYQASADLRRRPTVLQPALVRRRGASEAFITLRPSWARAVPGALPRADPNSIDIMRFAARAADSESDVTRVLDGWIALEALALGRPEAHAKVVCREVPDLVWHLAVRDVFVGPLTLLLATATPDASTVRAFVDPDRAGNEQRWLDLLHGAAPVPIEEALGRYRTSLTPLERWRLDEAGHLLNNGKLLAKRVDRHRLQAEWLMRRLREQRNAVAHGAAGDQPFARAVRVFDTSSGAPTDARVLGGFGVAALTEIGIAAHEAMGPAGMIHSTEALLATARSRHVLARNALIAKAHGQRALRQVPQPL